MVYWSGGACAMAGVAPQGDTSDNTVGSGGACAMAGVACLLEITFLAFGSGGACAMAGVALSAGVVFAQSARSGGACAMAGVAYTPILPCVFSGLQATFRSVRIRAPI